MHDWITLAGSMGGNGSKLDPQGPEHALDGIEARLGIGTQCLVEGLALDATGPGDFGHTSRLGDVPEGGGELSGVPIFQDLAEIFGHICIAGKVLGHIEFGQIVDFDLVTHLDLLH